MCLNGRCSEAITSSRVKKKDSIFNHIFLVLRLRVAPLWLSPSSETLKKTPQKMAALHPRNWQGAKRSHAAIFSGGFPRVWLDGLRERALTRSLDVISYVTTMLRVDFVDGFKLLDFKSKGLWF